MTNAQAAALLEQDAAAAAQCGRRSWKPFTQAAATYRRKGWTWQQIWERMAELGLVDKEDGAAFLSFRSSLSRNRSSAKRKLETPAK